MLFLFFFFFFLFQRFLSWSSILCLVNWQICALLKSCLLWAVKAASGYKHTIFFFHLYARMWQAQENFRLMNACSINGRVLPIYL